jgi:hypothetical protein
MGRSAPILKFCRQLLKVFYYKTVQYSLKGFDSYVGTLWWTLSATYFCEIWGFHDSEDSSRGILGCDTMDTSVSEVHAASNFKVKMGKAWTSKSLVS